MEYGSQAMPLLVSLRGEARIGIPLELKNRTMFPFAQTSAKAGLSPTGSGDDPVRFSVEAGVDLFIRPSSRWSRGGGIGSEFRNRR